MNPLTSPYNEQQDLHLLEESLAGNKKALEQLIQLHQPFIYNVAWKMVHDPTDAQDLTQEVLIKVITKLAQFSKKSSFRTWLYRIVMNEFLQSKRKTTEYSFVSFETYGNRLDSVPNANLNPEEEILYAELSKEMRIKCMSGMIMCLNREQRLIYILGDSFGIGHQLGAEIFGLTTANFRKKLSRARKDLYNYMNNKCGLVNKSNPCRCPKKAKTLSEMGLLKADSMEFNIDSRLKVSDYVESNYQSAEDIIYDLHHELFADLPVKEDFSKEKIKVNILGKDGINTLFKLD